MLAVAEGYMTTADSQLKRMRKLVMQERAGVDWVLVVGFPPSSTSECVVPKKWKDEFCI